jgi:hypothetical protein
VFVALPAAAVLVSVLVDTALRSRWLEIAIGCGVVTLLLLISCFVLYELARIEAMPFRIHFASK